jgi:hypothetical protein
MCSACPTYLILQDFVAIIIKLKHFREIWKS